jgi:ABC-type Fe3+/spermidine/putrescine transport system ATPase subunit
VRPENVSLSRSEPTTRGNKIQGTVIAIVMLGDTLEYVLQTASGAEYFARLPRNVETRPTEGESIWMNWSTEHAALFPFEQLSTHAHGPAQEATTGDDDG